VKYIGLAVGDIKSVHIVYKKVVDELFFDQNMCIKHSGSM
jgi:hypothetical protein